MRVFFILTLVTYLCTSCNQMNTEPVKEIVYLDKPEDTSVKRGKYLVNSMDCNACHTPKIMTERGPQMDASRLLSGYPSDRPIPDFDEQIVSQGVLFPHPDLTAAMGPWGISFAGNLTPDETGIGTWSLEQFKIALQKGKHKGLEGSRTLMPPMPWESYAQLSDADVEAVYNYLKSIPSIENIVPSHLRPE